MNIRGLWQRIKSIFSTKPPENDLDKTTTEDLIIWSIGPTQEADRKATARAAGMQ